nr:hypothetical protein [uncultured Enterobacter sp.]
MKAFILSVLPLLVAFVSPFLVYCQTTAKNKTVIAELLSRELAKNDPVAYLVESCVSRLHNIRPLPWSFLQKVLPLSNAAEIIYLVSTGRRTLDLFEISGLDVQFTRCFRCRRDRVKIMLLALVMAFFFLTELFSAFTYFFELLSPDLRPDSTGKLHALKLGLTLVQIVFFIAAEYFFFLQFIIICRARRRIEKISALISSNFPFTVNPEHANAEGEE